MKFAAFQSTVWRPPLERWLFFITSVLRLRISAMESFTVAAAAARTLLISIRSVCNRCCSSQAVLYLSTAEMTLSADRRFSVNLIISPAFFAASTIRAQSLPTASLYLSSL